jgi:hypothetical protein
VASSSNGSKRGFRPHSFSERGGSDGECSIGPSRLGRRWGPTFCPRKIPPRCGPWQDRLSRFNPPALGRIAGSVAAQRTYEQGLAASRPDGTRVLMPPVARSMSQGDGTRIKQREHPELHAGQPGPRRITFGERKNDMSSPKDPYCAAAQRRARPHAPLTNARSASEAVRIVFRPPSNDAISGVPDGSLAASGG